MTKSIVQLKLAKIISGGQTGADQGGLMAAVVLGLETGGWISRGYKTLTGPEPGLAGYGLIETASNDYLERTALNVENSDGTVRFAVNFNSPGEKATLRYIEMYRKPFYDVLFQSGVMGAAMFAKSDFIDWLYDLDIQTLNVAGNSERTAPGIRTRVLGYLIDALRDKVTPVKKW